VSDHQALPVRRSYEIDTDRLHGVVVEIDATTSPTALAVVQAGLHELPPAQRLVYGYDVAPAGLGAWVGDRVVRLRVWPALVDEDGEVTADDHESDDADVLVVDFRPGADAAAIEGIGRTGRVFIAGPEGGPVPLVLDIDQDLWRSVASEVTEAAAPPQDGR